jgi:hypothetical protein
MMLGFLFLCVQEHVQSSLMRGKSHVSQTLEETELITRQNRSRGPSFRSMLQCFCRGVHAVPSTCSLKNVVPVPVSI